MINRLLNLNKNNHLFLFGPRGCGKTTLLKKIFGSQNILWIDLLSEQDDDIYSRHPSELSNQLSLRTYDFVVIDEVQKIPKLLDIVHLEIEKKRKTVFIMTGSSARKLKRGSANLLGGRAFTFFLFPFTHQELGDTFQLSEVLQYGSLPLVCELTDEDSKNTFLRGYARTYLKEEVLVEQLVRNIEPFKIFLEIASQTNGQIVNFSKIARDVGVDDKTIKSYFSILEDTLIGFFLPAFHRSIRKQQHELPKFYLFDTGVKRALDRTLKVPLLEQTYAYGRAFEHFVILECFRLNEYYQADYKFSYFRAKSGLEVDLIIERPGNKDILVKIKSYHETDEQDARKIERLAKDWGRKVDAQIWSRDPRPKKNGGVTCLPWQEGMKMVFQNSP